MPCHHDLFENTLVENQILHEMYYKEFMQKIGMKILPHKDYEKYIKLAKIDGIRGNTMRFFVPNKYNGWNTYIEFPEWDEQVQDLTINPVEAARLLLWGANLRLHCGCPSFLFWGYQYILTKNDSAIVPETRMPTIRNPQMKGIVCKHLRKTLRVLPFHIGDMAKEIKQQRSALHIPI